MLKLTDEQIEEIALKAEVTSKNGEMFTKVIERGIRAALAAQAEPKPAPARKPWPKKPIEVDVGGGRATMYLASGTVFMDPEEAEAIALALDELPKCVAWMRAGVNLGGPAEVERRSILLRVDAAGFDLPEVEP